MKELKVKITRIDKKFSDIPLPEYATSGSAGMDLRAAVDAEIRILPGKVGLIPTGLIVELPDGFEAQIRPRSGLAANHRVGILNSPGTIDSDYRGEIKVIIVNFGEEPFIVRRGDRIAQMIIAPYTRVRWDEVEYVEGTRRGEGGFGHTGNK